tara:strand:- start:191 stop:1267 length:1077 start_codon:yes stop_codon:yes gene_type:complete
MLKVNHNKPIKKVIDPQYHADGCLYLDTSNDLWYAGHNSGGYSLGGPSKRSWDDSYTHNSGKQLVKVMSNVKDAIYAGWSGHETIYVLKNDGKMWCSGYGGYGNLGDNLSTSRSSYKQITRNQFGNETVKSFIVSADYHTKTVYCITNKNQLWGWGYNGLGQLAQGNDTNLKEPKMIFTGGTVKRVWATRGHYTSVYVLDSNNKLWACGYNNQGQLGIGNVTRQKTWKLVSWGAGDSLAKGENIIDIHTNMRNDGHTSVYIHYKEHGTGKGKIKVAGRNNEGQLGLGNKVANITTFRSIPYGPDDIDKVHVCHGEEEYAATLFVTDKSGTLYVCGKENYYMTGSADEPIRTTLARIDI